MGGEELVAVYSADGEVVGSATRRRMRAEGLWHAASAILVRSGDRVFVHRRTDDKDVFPGMHDCWAGGVVAAGETPWDCAERELAEELGITGVPLAPLFTTSADVEGTRIHLYAYEAWWDGEVVLQDSEIVSGGWMTFDELRLRLADPSWPFVPDGRIAIEEFFRRELDR